MEIENRQVFVTGASRGIGRAFAKMCAENKAHLHLVLRSQDMEIVKEMEAAGAKSVTIWEADLSSRASVQTLIEKIKPLPIDILFNNAGMLTGGLLEEQPLDEIYQMLQVNVNALIHLTHEVLPGMLERKRGKIINNSSVAAYMHFPCSSTYSASKAAVMAFTNSLRLELKGTGVTTLLLITPGVKTRMFDAIEDKYSKNIETPKDAISPGQYAKIIREAILHDIEVFEPGGLTGFGLKMVKYARSVFEREVLRRFKR